MGMSDPNLGLSGSYHASAALSSWPFPCAWLHPFNPKTVDSVKENTSVRLFCWKPLAPLGCTGFMCRESVRICVSFSGSPGKCFHGTNSRCCAEVNLGHSDSGSAKGGAQSCQAAYPVFWISLQWFYMGAGEGFTYISVSCRSSFENTVDK